MTHVTPVESKKSEIIGTGSGPRAETILLIRYFARVYEAEQTQKETVKKTFVN